MKNSRQTRKTKTEARRAAVWTGAGSGLGGVARCLMEVGVSGLAGVGFPFGVLAVNVAGSLAIGIFGALFLSEKRKAVRQFWMVGFCGGFTTFSMFSWQTVELMAADRILAAFWNFAATAGGGIGAVGVGVWLGRRLCGKKEFAAAGRGI